MHQRTPYLTAEVLLWHAKRNGSAMDEDPSKNDEDLFNRLNALKKSSLSLQQNEYNPQPSLDTPICLLTVASPFASQSATPKPAADLTERFNKLKFGSPSANVKLDVVATPEAPIDIDGTQPASPTLEELLIDLAADEDHYTLNPNELTEAEVLLAEARRALPAEDEDTQAQPDTGSADGKVTSSGSGSQSDREDGLKDGDRGQDEDVEADIFLQKILDEVALEKDHDDPATTSQRPSDSTNPTAGPNEEHAAPQSSRDADSSQLMFPSAPTHLPPPSPLGGLSLPSAPKIAPRPQPVKKYKYTDAEIDSWCIICLADATVRCLGCAGDLYCDVGITSVTHQHDSGMEKLINIHRCAGEKDIRDLMLASRSEDIKPQY